MEGPGIPYPSHNTRNSMLSLYDLLQDLDDGSLQAIIHEMNNTTTQNMAVGQAITAIESDDPSYSLATARSNMQAPAMSRQLSRSQRIRLSLQTIFQPSQRRSAHVLSPISSSPKSRSSPAYKRISRPFPTTLPPEITVADLQAMLYAELFETTPQSPLTSSPSCSSLGSSPGVSKIRRYPSTLDMALEVERSVSEGSIEGIGLGMLEPRPLTPATPQGYSPISPGGFAAFVPLTPAACGLSTMRAPSPVMDGIFEVMESH